MAQQINLYDASLCRKRDWLALGNVVAAGLILVGGVAALGYIAGQDLPSLKAQTAANETQLKGLRDQITALGQQSGRKPDPQIERELAAMLRLQGARGEILAVLTQSLGPDAESFAEYLRGLARQTLAGLWLTDVSFDTASGGIEIRGRTVDPALLPEYIRRLNRERAFQGRSFAALKMSEGKEEAPQREGGDAAASTAARPELAEHRPPYHEFMLIPVKGEGAGKGAALSQTATGAGGAG